tara:strand:- start:33 stop:587 length:555 start_codon:yes stop_codon:yes gene_type:complete
MRRKILQPKIYVYRNLHQKCWSVKYRGLVIAHTPTAFMWDVEFVVNEAGRQRVLKEGVKNVHAYSACELDDIFLPSGAEFFSDDLKDSVFDCTNTLGDSLSLTVRYEPKRRGSFLERESGRNIKDAFAVFLTARGGLKAQRNPTKQSAKARHANQNFKPRLNSAQRKEMEGFVRSRDHGGNIES